MYGRYSFSQLYHINLTFSSLHDLSYTQYMLRLQFWFRKQIHCIFESIKFIWSANDWIWEHNFHTYHVAHFLRETICYKFSLFHHLAFIKNALWEDITILSTSQNWTRTLLPNCHLWFDRFECLNTLPRTFGLDPAEGVWQFC